MTYAGEACVCHYCLHEGLPILLVARTCDCDWQFVCAVEGQVHTGYTIAKIHLIHLVQEFPGMKAIVDQLLQKPLGTGARRNDAVSPWEFESVPVD